MEKPIGQIIKDVLEKSGVKLTVFAGRIGTTRQNVYKIFEKDSISTSRLKKISEVLEYDFFEHFRMVSKDGESRWPRPKEDMPVRPPRYRVAELQKELEITRDRIEILEARLRDKEEIINLLRAKLEED
ncbi:MAG: helix-turn-helix transcriptional regulator [Bacteroidota bacterium]